MGTSVDRFLRIACVGAVGPESKRIELSPECIVRCEADFR